MHRAGTTGSQEEETENCKAIVTPQELNPEAESIGMPGLAKYVDAWTAQHAVAEATQTAMMQPPKAAAMQETDAEIGEASQKGEGSQRSPFVTAEAMQDPLWEQKRNAFWAAHEEEER